MKKTILMGMEDVRTDVDVWEIELEGQYVVIKPEALTEKYREAKYQLVRCCGGFGCTPGKMGNAIFCQEMYADNPEHYRRERYDKDFLGVATEKAIEEFKQLYGWKEE